jgi:Tfp pilus assembly protein PilE
VRRFTPVELAIAIAILGSLLAVAVPAFSRDLHASRLVEPTEGLARIGAAAVAYA